MEQEYDVIIIGAGAAGLTAAIYTSRKKLNTLVVTESIGGQTNLTGHIENYPGVDPGHGIVLMKKFHDQAVRFGAEIVTGRVTKVRKRDSGFDAVLGDGRHYTSRAVIVSAGKIPKKLGIPGEERFMGKGVSTCVTCDAPLYRNKRVAVIGGGNSAVDGAIELSAISEKVYLIHRREQFRADEIALERLRSLRNVELMLNTLTVEIKGGRFVESVAVENVNTLERKEIPVNGVFVEIGFTTDVSMVAELVKLNSNNEIVIDSRCRTSVDGIFAAGDVTNIPFKQTVISAGEGAKAGLEVYRYIKGHEDIMGDWRPVR